jgi:hypothetical protein
MFHSQRSQMSVRDEIAVHARQRQKFAQELGWPFGWNAGSHASHASTCRHASPVGSGCSNTGGLVTSRRKATKLAHERPTGPEPFNCRALWDAEQKSSRAHRRECWRRPISLVGFALRNGKGFDDVVKTCYSQLANRD